MQVPQSYLNHYLASLKVKCTKPQKKDPSGTLLACFALRPGIARRNWEVLTLKGHHDQLPMVPMWPTPSSQGRVRFISQLDGMSVSNCLSWIDRRVGSINDDEDACCRSVRRAIHDLRELVAEPFFMHAIFSSKVLRVHIRSFDGPKTHCSLFAFHTIPDVHVALLKTSDKLAYTPLTYLQCLQHISDSNANDAGFRSRIHQEFADLCTYTEDSPNQVDSGRQSSFFATTRSLKLMSYLPPWK